VPLWLLARVMFSATVQQARKELSSGRLVEQSAEFDPTKT
jgi:hypothetical protein